MYPTPSPPPRPSQLHQGGRLSHTCCYMKVSWRCIVKSDCRIDCALLHMSAGMNALLGPAGNIKEVLSWCQRAVMCCDSSLLSAPILLLTRSWVPNMGGGGNRWRPIHSVNTQRWDSSPWVLDPAKIAGWHSTQSLPFAEGKQTAVNIAESLGAIHLVPFSRISCDVGVPAGDR